VIKGGVYQAKRWKEHIIGYDLEREMMNIVDFRANIQPLALYFTKIAECL
jgi:hypothetical protein